MNQVKKVVDMNEKIKELAVKAKVEHCISHVRLEEFAELIVKECAKVCDDLDIDDWGDKSFDDGTYYCSRAIKQHFGVEDVPN